MDIGRKQQSRNVSLSAYTRSVRRQCQCRLSASANVNPAANANANFTATRATPACVPAARTRGCWHPASLPACSVHAATRTPATDTGQDRIGQEGQRPYMCASLYRSGRAGIDAV